MQRPKPLCFIGLDVHKKWMQICMRGPSRAAQPLRAQARNLRPKARIARTGLRVTQQGPYAACRQPPGPSRNRVLPPRQFALIWRCSLRRSDGHLGLPAREFAVVWRWSLWLSDDVLAHRCRRSSKLFMTPVTGLGAAFA